MVLLSKPYLCHCSVVVDVVMSLFQMNSTAPFGEQAEVTMKTNFLGTLAVFDTLRPLLRRHARWLEGLHLLILVKLLSFWSCLLSAVFCRMGKYTVGNFLFIRVDLIRLYVWYGFWMEMTNL